MTQDAGGAQATLFQYADDLEPFLGLRDPDTFVAQVPWNLRDKAELLNVLWSALRLPGYFGHNWDALDECLRDFHWLDARRIVLVHTDLPTRLAPRDLKTYLEVLAGAVETWRRDGTREFVVVFPKDTGQTLQRALSGGGLTGDVP